jgi:glycosyltransferase involved in cell wall biosynthesis
LKQGLLPKQYIFIDGGSIDGTVDYILSKECNFVSCGIDLHLIHQESKGGIYEAWNIALSYVDKESDFIFILNSDDWYCHNTISYVSDFFSQNRNAGILCGASKNISKSGKMIISYNRNLFLFPFLMPLIHPACFIKTSVYSEVGKFNENYRVSGDYDLLYRAHKLGVKFSFTNQVLVNRLMGGYADLNHQKARNETFVIGCTYSKNKIWPLMAFILRWLLNR